MRIRCITWTSALCTIYDGIVTNLTLAIARSFLYLSPNPKGHMRPVVYCIPSADPDNAPDRRLLSNPCSRWSL